MQFFIPFGDWSNDGHGRYETVLVEAPSMEHLLNAQNKIKEKYGKYFFSSFANDYGEAYVGEEVWQALIDTEYPIERFRETQDDIAWDKCNSIAEAIVIALKVDPGGKTSVKVQFLVCMLVAVLKLLGSKYG